MTFLLGVIVGVEPIKGPNERRPSLPSVDSRPEVTPGSNAHVRHHDSTAWSSQLRHPSQTQTEPCESLTSPQQESFLRFLYRGNFQNFGMGTAATVVSSTVTGLTAWAASHLGASEYGCAVAAALASYVWYPLYFGLNHYLRDRHIIQQRTDEGQKHANWRTWGSRITQSLIGEGIWLGTIIPAQVAVAHHFGLNAGWAATVTHVPLAMTINIALISPYRNFSQWLWGLEKPGDGGVIKGN